jgi:hypothetical protein
MASKRRLVSCLRRSDMEPHFVCQVCSHPGADVRPDFDWDKQPQQPTRARRRKQLDRKPCIFGCGSW